MIELRDLPRPVGFVLGGGASLGAVQPGMLRALRERGVYPDQITATSVGALNGAVLAAYGPEGVDRLERMWTELQRSDVFPGNVLNLLWRLGRSSSHIVEPVGLKRLVAATLDAETFEDLRVPLAVVTLDLATGDQRVLDTGPLVPALLASAAIPGVFPPVLMNGFRLVDGGVVANVPVHHALGRGARSIVVLDTTVPAPATPGGPTVADILARVSQIQFRAQLMSSLPPVAAEVPVIYLPAPRARKVSPIEFHHSAELMDDAYQAAAFLEHLQVTGPGVYGVPYDRYVLGEANAPGTGTSPVGG